MTILQAGYQRSGNYWLWRLLQSSATAAGLARGSFIEHEPIYAVARNWKLSFPEEADVDMIDIEADSVFYTIRPMYSRKVNDLDEYLRLASHVWTHCPHPGLAAHVLRRFDRIVYVIRDARDAMLSEVAYEQSDFLQREYAPPTEPTDLTTRVREGAFLDEWQRHVAQWLLHGPGLGVHFVFYERLLADFDEEYRRILRHLRLELSDADVAMVRAQVSFSTMKKSSPGHLHSGQASRWRSLFDADQQGIAARRCGRLLRLLGYPLTEAEASSAANLLPVLPDLSSGPVRATLRKLAGDPLADEDVVHIEPETVLELDCDDASYRLTDRDGDPNETCVQLFGGGREYTLPGDAFDFVVRCVATRRLSGAQAARWLGTAYAWADVVEVLSFLVRGGLLLRADDVG